MGLAKLTVVIVMRSGPPDNVTWRPIAGVVPGQTGRQSRVRQIEGAQLLKDGTSSTTLFAAVRSIDMLEFIQHLVSGIVPELELRTCKRRSEFVATS